MPLEAGGCQPWAIAAMRRAWAGLTLGMRAPKWRILLMHTTEARMLSELQIGYLAGILDGEGQVSVVRQKRSDAKRKRAYGLRTEVRVTQRRRILLSTILDWTGSENATITSTGLGGKFFQLRFKAQWLRDN